jgi:hypothetical protein
MAQSNSPKPFGIFNLYSDNHDAFTRPSTTFPPMLYTTDQALINFHMIRKPFSL